MLSTLPSENQQRASQERSFFFFSQFKEYVTAFHAEHIMLILSEEFEDDLLVVLDEALYF